MFKITPNIIILILLIIFLILYYTESINSSCKINYFNVGGQTKDDDSPPLLSPGSGGEDDADRIQQEKLVNEIAKKEEEIETSTGLERIELPGVNRNMPNYTGKAVLQSTAVAVQLPVLHLLPRARIVARGARSGVYEDY